MRVVLGLEPSAIEFKEGNSGGAYPYLIGVGALREAARTGSAIGIAGAESSSVSVSLDNRAKKLTAIARRPLRVGVEIYDDDDNLFFAGTVSSVEYGDDVTWQVDA